MELRIIYTGMFVNEKTINYITKYMTKEDEDHPGFIGKVLCSKGIGMGYTKREDAKNHVYKKVGEKVFEELFDAKGKSKGFKEVFKDFKME